MLGRPRRKLTQEEYKLLTALRIESAYKAFSLSQLIEKLSTIGNGFWREAAFVPFMVQYGVISKNAYNKYSFDKAFNFEQLKTAVHKYQCKKSKQRIRAKRAAIKVEEEVTIAIPVNPIEDAINLLKTNGYRVLIKHFDVEKALLNPEKSVQDFIVWADC